MFFSARSNLCNQGRSNRGGGQGPQVFKSALSPVTKFPFPGEKCCSDCIFASMAFDL